MTLSAPVSRRMLHHRRLDLCGYEREDNLWDIEGHLVDLKSYPVEHHTRGHIPVGEPFHDMWLRLTIDSSLMIRDVEAQISKSPYPECGAIANDYRKMHGVRIGPGWHRRVQELMGGAHGCTHVSELFGPLGTVAYQTIGPARIASREERDAGGKPRRIDTCHVYRSDGAIAKERWPEFYTDET